VQDVAKDGRAMRSVVVVREVTGKQRNHKGC
jgi:hypothetical protein